MVAAQVCPTSANRSKAAPSGQRLDGEPKNMTFIVDLPPSGRDSVSTPHADAIYRPLTQDDQTLAAIPGSARVETSGVIRRAAGVSARRGGSTESSVAGG